MNFRAERQKRREKEVSMLNSERIMSFIFWAYGLKYTVINCTILIKLMPVREVQLVELGLCELLFKIKSRQAVFRSEWAYAY